jgi:hypothetical protein
MIDDKVTILEFKVGLGVSQLQRGIGRKCRVNIVIDCDGLPLTWIVVGSLKYKQSCRW